MGFPLHHFCLQIRKLYSDKISWQNKGHFECWPKTYIVQSKLFPSDKMAREEEREEGHILYILQNFIFVLCKKCTCSVCKLISWEADYCTCKLCKEQKILQKSGLHEAPPEQEFEENCGIFSAWDNPPPLLFGLSQLAPYLETTFILHLWRA